MHESSECIQQVLIVTSHILATPIALGVKRPQLLNLALQAKEPQTVIKEEQSLGDSTFRGAVFKIANYQHIDTLHTNEFFVAVSTLAYIECHHKRGGELKARL